MPVQQYVSGFTRWDNMLNIEFKYLFKLYCMPLNVRQLWDLSSKCIDWFYTAWRKAVRRVYNLPPRTHSLLLPFIVNEMYIIEILIHKRFFQFAHSIFNSENKCKIVWPICVKRELRQIWQQSKLHCQ
jgi:hypothetical protein